MRMTAADPVPRPRVAFQGEPGAYGYAAVALRWAGAARAIPAPTFATVLALVCDGGAEYGVLPVWNTIIGEVREPCAALRDAGTRVERVDEVLVPVHQCLLALHGASLASLRVVGSHPAALAQCGRFFADHPWIAAHAAYDTAGAARELALLARPSVRAPAEGAPPWHHQLTMAPHELGVVASAAAAAHHGLQVLAEDIQDEPANATRFVVVRAREEGRW